MVSGNSQSEYFRVPLATVRCLHRVGTLLLEAAAALVAEVLMKTRGRVTHITAATCSHLERTVM
jgi:hypothetical protein